LRFACANPHDRIGFSQSNKDSGLGARAAGQFRDVLEVAGGVTLALALAVSLLVELQMWRAIRNGGKETEHEDYKIRIEARRIENKKRELLEHEAVLEKLKEAHELVEKEKADVKAMHDHDLPTFDAEDVTSRTDPNQTTFANPLDVDGTGVDDGEEEARG
jgi:cell division protein FtsI/penicillin-binding protein 2